MEAALNLGSHPKPSDFPLSVEILGVKVTGLRTCSIWQHRKGVLPTSHFSPAPNDPFFLSLFLGEKKIMLTYTSLKPKMKRLHLGGGKNLAVGSSTASWKLLLCVESIII